MTFALTFELRDLARCALGQALMAGIAGQRHGNAAAAQQKPDLLTPSILPDHQSTLTLSSHGVGTTGGVEGKYLTTQRDLYGDGDHLSQQTTVEGHHEGYRVVIRKHQGHLGRERTLKVSPVSAPTRTKRQPSGASVTPAGQRAQSSARPWDSEHEAATLAGPSHLSAWS